MITLYVLYVFHIYTNGPNVGILCVLYVYPQTGQEGFIQSKRDRYIHTYTRTYKHTSTHTCIHAYMHRCIRTCVASLFRELDELDDGLVRQLYGSRREPRAGTSRRRRRKRRKGKRKEIMFKVGGGGGYLFFDNKQKKWINANAKRNEWRLEEEGRRARCSSTER
jgi:hypothetical protein